MLKTKQIIDSQLQYDDRSIGYIEEIKRLNILNNTISQINKILLNSESKSELFQKICNTLIKMKNYKFVWIGIVKEGSNRVTPAAQAGFENDYISSIKVTIDDSRYGRGPTGTAIKTHKPFIMRDIKNNPVYKPCRKEALKRGYLTSIALPFIHRGKVVGALNVYSVEKDAFGDEEVEFLMEVAEDIAIGIKSLRYEEELKKSYVRLQKTLYEMIDTITLISEMRDPYTSGHQKRVALLSSAIAKKMNLPEDQIEGIYIAAILHDIGKISIPIDITSKPGKISEAEFSIIKTHPEVGYKILKNIEFPGPVAKIILQHHERLNGSGYPYGISDKEIILEAKILGVADVVDAMSSHRPYRPALGIDETLEEIKKNKGTLYDPEVVDACIKIIRKKGLNFK